MRYYSTWRRPDIIIQLLKVPQPPADIPFANRNDNINQLKSNTMEVKVKEIKMGKDEFRKSVDHYWELFRKEVTLPNDPFLVQFTRQVFETGFLSGLVDILDTTKEAIQGQRKSSSEHPSNVIPININHDPSKAN